MYNFSRTKAAGWGGVEVARSSHHMQHCSGSSVPGTVVLEQECALVQWCMWLGLGRVRQMMV